MADKTDRRNSSYLKYPYIVCDLNKLRDNLAALKERCQIYNVAIAGVIKGFNGITEIAKVYEDYVEYLASSRLEQLRQIKEDGLETPLMAIRISMPDEVEDLVDLCQISLQSDPSVIELINEAAKRQGKIHKIVLMADLGDLREGFWNKDHLYEEAEKIENEYKNLYLAGVGTNLGCYGSIMATPEKLQELVDIAREVEKRIGRKLDIVSGGASSSLLTLFDGKFPKGINQLRLGESVLMGLGTWGLDLDFLHEDVFELWTQVVEVEMKPSFPVGERSVDAFGNVVEYEDIGIHKRALVAIGKLDYGNDPMTLKPLDKNIRVLGASSDHTILDVTKAGSEIEVGDIIKFTVSYGNLIYLTNTNTVRVITKE